MRLVLDTNVVVSALLHPGRTPDRAIGAARSAGAVMLVDERIEREYRDVLGRPKFARVDPARRDALLEGLLSGAERVVAAPAYSGSLVDDDDRAFVEVALAGRADLLVTGNTKHFPPGIGVEVVGPTGLLARLSLTR